eukprot:GFUD01035386.1.p1 GENE.GFUD01035386.1~~GFUD01035386.1.p1  ORF type:complete len:1282 (+),score=333.95 GFUD01035386.1:93-3938(+)
MITKLKEMNPNKNLYKPVKRCPQFSPVNLLESDLNLLECLMTDLVVPQQLLDQFPQKYKDRFSTGVTWYKNRTFVVNSWIKLFTKFQTCLTKMEKSIITNKENYLKYILKKYEWSSIVRHCDGNMYMVEEAFFKIYKHKICQNSQKISQLADKLPRSAASINLLEDFKRKTREKRKCLKVIRHIFEQDRDKPKQNKTAVKLKPSDVKESKERRINEGFDFVSVNLPKLNIDSFVRMNKLSRNENLSGLFKMLKSQPDAKNDNWKGSTEIDFKQICSDIKIVSDFSDTKVLREQFPALQDHVCTLADESMDTSQEYARRINEENMDIYEDHEKLPIKYAEETSDYPIVEIFEKLDYEAICSNIRLLSDLFDPRLDDETIGSDVDEVDDGLTIGKTESVLNEDYSESLMIEKSQDVETSFILDGWVKEFNADSTAQGVSLEELLDCEDIIDMENVLTLSKVEEANQNLPMNDEDCIDYLISLSENNYNEPYHDSEETKDGNILDNSYEMVDEEISFLVQNNSKAEREKSPENAISSDPSNNHVEDKDEAVNRGQVDDVCDTTVDHFEKSMKPTKDGISEKALNPISSTIKTAPTAETKILFCSWMSAPKEDDKDDIEKINARTIEIDIDYKQICSDVAIISGIVEAEFNVSPGFSCPREDLSNPSEDNDKKLGNQLCLKAEETSLTKEEETLLKQAFLSGTGEEGDKEPDYIPHPPIGTEEKAEMKSVLDLDLQVEEESAVATLPTRHRGVENEVTVHVKSESNDKYDATLEIKSAGNECIQPLANKMKIVESFDDMFKSFLNNPMKTPLKEDTDNSDVNLFVKSKEQLEDSGKNISGKEKGVSEVLDELEKLDTTKIKVKSKVKKFEARKPLISLGKEDLETVSNLKHFDVKQEIVDKTDLLPDSKAIRRNEVITLDDDSDSETEPKIQSSQSRLKSEPLAPSSSPSVVYVPQNAKILHVPDNTQIVRVTDAGSPQSQWTSDDKMVVKGDSSGNSLGTKAVQHTTGNISLHHKSVGNTVPDHVKDHTRNGRAGQARHTSVSGLPSSRSHEDQVRTRRSSHTPAVQLSSQSSQVISRPVQTRARSSTQTIPGKIHQQTTRTQLRSATQNTQVISRPVQTRSRNSTQPTLPDKMLHQAARPLPSLNTQNVSGSNFSEKRKKQIKTVPARKSARLGTDSKRKVGYASDPDSDGGNQQSELLEFISENIGTKAEMKPGGKISNIYHCNICPFNNISKWHLENHVESTHGDFDVSYQCDLCDYIAKTRANYYAHGKKKHDIYMEPQY